MYSMKKEGKKKLFLKEGNKGLSLVEVVVAIAILAVVTIPLLNIFVSSFEYNRKAREKQRTTNIAQSIIEGIKAYDSEELCAQFSGASSFSVYKGIGSASYTETAHGTIDLGDSQTRFQHEFVLKGIEYDTNKYDVKVSMISYPYQNVSGLENINTYNDAVYKQDPALNATSYNLIMNDILADLNADTSFEACTIGDLNTDKIYITKETTISASNIAGVADPTYSVVVQNVYYYSVNGLERRRTDGTTQAVSLAEQSIVDAFSPQEIYNNSSTKANGASLENIYLFYYPAYKSGQSGSPIDAERIIIQNNTGSAKDVFLIKQYTAGMSETILNICETDYQPTIEGAGANSITLYHNLKTNLSTSGTLPQSPIINGLTAVEGLIKSSDEALLYNITVSVYEDGAADSGFPAGKLLLEIEGSKDD